MSMFSMCYEKNQYRETASSVEETSDTNNTESETEYVEEGEWVLQKSAAQVKHEQKYGKKTKSEVAKTEKNRKKREKRKEKELAHRQYLNTAPEKRGQFF